MWRQGYCCASDSFAGRSGCRPLISGETRMNWPGSPAERRPSFLLPCPGSPLLLGSKARLAAGTQEPVCFFPWPLLLQWHVARSSLPPCPSLCRVLHYPDSPPGLPHPPASLHCVALVRCFSFMYTYIQMGWRDNGCYGWRHWMASPVRWCVLTGDWRMLLCAISCVRVTVRL